MESGTEKKERNGGKKREEFSVLMFFAKSSGLE